MKRIGILGYSGSGKPAFQSGGLVRGFTSMR